MVRWIMHGTLFTRGIMHQRSPGDIDFIEANKAKNLQNCGYVEILNEKVPEVLGVDEDDYDFGFDDGS